MTSTIQGQFNFYYVYGNLLRQQQAAQAGDAAATGGSQDTGKATAADTFINFLKNIREASVLTEIDSGDGDDEVAAEGHEVRVDAGAGNDRVSAVGLDVAANGGDGDDIIDAQGYKVAVKGGAGNDVIHAASHVPSEGPIPLGRVSGGEGNDEIFTYGLTGYVNGGNGDDLIQADHSTLIQAYGGSGNDTIIAERGGLNLFGGAGDDRIISRGNLFKGEVFGGAGKDDIAMSGRAVKAYGGTGDDRLAFENVESLIGYQWTEEGAEPSIEFHSVANGGLGDDHLSFSESYGNIEYHAGDGNDTIEGADERSILKLGAGLSFEQTTFSTSIEGTDLTMAFADGGSITFKDFQTKGLPRIEFSDGRLLDASSTIAYAGGDPDAYTANDIA